MLGEGGRGIEQYNLKFNLPNPLFQEGIFPDYYTSGNKM
jgi:hypothetical protein